MREYAPPCRTAPRLLLAALLACAAPGICSAQSGGWQSDERCRLATDSLPAAYARCGTLQVPLDPAAPDGPKIELFVARLGAFSAEPRPDPLLLISGGPGQSTVDMYLQLRGAFEGARRDRDIILVDQRGTGRSASGFTCRVPDDLSLDTAAPEDLDLSSMRASPSSSTIRAITRRRSRCRISTACARRSASSNGTSTACRTARASRNTICGAIPRTCAPSCSTASCRRRSRSGPTSRAKRSARSSRSSRAAPPMRSAARNSPACRSCSPRCSTRLDAGAAEDTDPPPISALELRTLVRFMSYNAATVALLPVLISEAHAGNYAPLAGQARTLLRELPESLSFPMSNSVMCAEDAPYVADEATGGLEATYLGTGIMDGIRLICGRWPVGPVDADFKTPVVSDAPVLLLSGEYDPITPPTYAERVKSEGLRNSVHVIGSRQGHGLIAVGCVPRLLRSFLDKPSPAELDTSCLSASRRRRSS